MSESVIDFASMEAPVLESPEVVETPTEVEEVAEPTTEETEPEQAEAEKPEGGKPASLKAVRDAVKSFSEANPQMAPHLKTMLNDALRYKAMTEAFPDVDTARSVKAALEAAGGIEGLTKLSSLQDFVEDINSKWDSGDPSALDTVFEDGGKGAVKILPHYMNRVEKADPEAFGTAIKPHLVRNLESANFVGTVNGILRTIASGTDPKVVLAQVKDAVESMGEWFQGQKRDAEKTNLDSLEPERQKFTERETALAEREYKQFEGEVNAEVAPHMNNEFSRHMKPYAAALNALPEKMRQAVAREWMGELGKAFGKQYNDQIATAMKSRSRNKSAIANIAKTRISAVSEAVTKKIVADYKLSPGKTAPKTPKAGDVTPPANTAAIKVNERPADNQIDWDKDPDRMLFITGKAYLKGSGKLVKWR
jgi:hypothetical protein